MLSVVFANVCRTLTHAGRCVKPLALACALGLVCTPAARADGDPASDVLPSQTVFYGSELDLKSKAAAQLPALLDEAKQAQGHETRVAILTAPEDMGEIQDLWEDQVSYGPLLGSEVAYVYRGRLLIVMPSGYAMFHIGHSSVREQRVLDKLPAPAQPADMLPGAMKAVQALAAAEGKRLRIPDVAALPDGVKQPVSHYAQTQRAAPPTAGIPSSRPATKSAGGTWLFALPVLALVVFAAGYLTLRRVRERRSTRAG
jgi:hypothetical protein